MLIVQALIPHGEKQALPIHPNDLRNLSEAGMNHSPEVFLSRCLLQNKPGQLIQAETMNLFISKARPGESHSSRVSAHISQQSCAGKWSFG